VKLNHNNEFEPLFELDTQPGDGLRDVVILAARDLGGPVAIQLAPG
jgi:hypothetical protein